MKFFTGIVVSKKMEKTVMVAVERFKIHPIYKKRTKIKNKFPSHDDLGVKVGDKVRIQECRPISKTKKWKVVEVLGKQKIKNKKSKTKT